ncbi:MAG: DNA cytosine methyltransferase [Methanosarcinales archaeon]|jgi:DNA (cytosine-5)-methyltransferase 1|nr:DNA cytosine methyltransferase [Methanosarcinales archaeon]
MPNYIDIFAGCGGLSLGLHNAGWTGLFAVEKSPFAFSTLKSNLIEERKHFYFPDWLEETNHDINELLLKNKDQLLSLRGQVDLVAGGPPCQGFSMAGKRIEEDERNKLVYSYIKFIDLVRPKLIFFENVKGFTYSFVTEDKRGIPYSKIVVEKLEDFGYDIKSKVIDFSNYGVPQRRERFILVGVLKNSSNRKAEEFFELIEKMKYDFLLEKGISENVTVDEAISDLLEQNGTTQCPDRKNFAAGKYGTPQSSYQKLMRDQVAKKGVVADSHSFAKHNLETKMLFSTLLKKYPARNKRLTSKERDEWGVKKRGITVLDGNSKCPTLTTHPDDYIHYSEPRILTVREYARIQTFPDSYKIKEKYTTGGKLRKFEVPRYTQIGNAIPPLFGELAGLALKEMGEMDE